MLNHQRQRTHKYPYSVTSSIQYKQEKELVVSKSNTTIDPRTVTMIIQKVTFLFSASFFFVSLTGPFLVHIRYTLCSDALSQAYNIHTYGNTWADHLAGL